MLAPTQTKLTTERRPLAGLADIAAPWRALAAHAAEPNVFYDPDFALAAAPVLGCGVEAILVWSAAAPRRLLGLFPFTIATRRYGVKLPLMVGWTHPFGPLGTPLIDRDACAEVVAAFLDHVAGDDALPKHLLLPLLHEAGAVAAALRAGLAHGACAAFGRHQRAMLRPQGDRATYLEHAIGRKRRKELRRQRHRLADAGALNFSPTQAPGDIAPALADFLALEATGWKGRAGTAIAQHAGTRRFVETAVAALAARGQARVARLWRQSQPIACAVTLTSGNGAWGWKISYDERCAGGSPGVQLYLDLTAAMLEEPAIAFVDSCATPDHPMIDHLWRERLPIADWLVALEPGATFGFACRLETARRHAVTLARRLRERLRRRGV
jgi:CelD/BcsL family acetyltransferase involved in cellulose biosynthesis